MGDILQWRTCVLVAIRKPPRVQNCGKHFMITDRFPKKKRTILWCKRTKIKSQMKCVLIEYSLATRNITCLLCNRFLLTSFSIGLSPQGRKGRESGQQSKRVKLYWLSCIYLPSWNTGHVFTSATWWKVINFYSFYIMKLRLKFKIFLGLHISNFF